MDDLIAHQRAQAAFASVLANVTDDQMGVQSPCAEWTAKGVIDHVIGGNQWVQQLVDRQPPDLPDDVTAAHATSAAGAEEVFAAPDGLTREYKLPFGAVPGSLFIHLRTGDVLTHAWDLAKATGQSTDLDPEVAARELAFSRQTVGPAFRGPGRPFGEERPCPPGRAAADELAAFLGRAVD